ncbi:MAG: hypothetical protein WCX85_01400 [Bacilli bacterium]|jgi:hypothetical protein|nr:hypothetical protein [Bacilli bacterium]
MNLYQILEQNQKFQKFLDSEENLFYLKNRIVLERFPMYKHLAQVSTDFEIMRSNIIIRSLQNKKAIEAAVRFAVKNNDVIKREKDMVFFRTFIREKIIDLPFANDQKTRLYVPIFNRVINQIYSEEFEKLLLTPYDKLVDEFETLVVDPFEIYNFSLYDSLFTQFVKVYSDDDIMAVFHYDFQAIYFIDKQGRLDNKIALFDRGIRHPDFHHILERIRPVIAAYVTSNKEAMLQALVDKKLISEKLINRINSQDYRFRMSLIRKIK